MGGDLIHSLFRRRPQRPSGATTWYGFGQSGTLVQMRLPNRSLPVSLSPGLQTHSFVLLSGVVPSLQDQTQRPSGATTWYGAGHTACASTCLAFVKASSTAANKSQETRCFFITNPSSFFDVPKTRTLLRGNVDGSPFDLKY